DQQKADAQPGSSQDAAAAKANPPGCPTLGTSLRNDTSQQLRSIPSSLNPENPVPPDRDKIEPTGAYITDPVVQNWFSSLNPLAMPTPILNFEGLCCSGYPPDTVGDVGPNNYVQFINTRFQIFSKTGATIYVPTTHLTLWNGF